MLNILTMKWGDFYGPEYVNRLYCRLQQAMSIPFRFVCFTDNNAGLDTAIEALPLPDVGLGGSSDLRWRKVALFRKDLFGLSGTAIFLDLDVVVVDDLAPMAALPGGFHVCHERTLFPKRMRNLRRFLFNRRRYRWANAEGNTSVIRFEIGQCGAIFDDYLADTEGVVNKFRREQEFVTLKARQLGILNFWPPEMCVSFQHTCMPPPLLPFLRAPALPKSARIVIFTSGLTMEDALAGRGRHWSRPVGQCDWLRQHWLVDHA